MHLKPFLHGVPIHVSFERVIIADEDQGKHSCCCKEHVIRCPSHQRKAVCIHWQSIIKRCKRMNDSSPRVRKDRHIEASSNDRINSILVHHRLHTNETIRLGVGRSPFAYCITGMYAPRYIQLENRELH
jgi:hypothetical protein